MWTCLLCGSNSPTTTFFYEATSAFQDYVYYLMYLNNIQTRNTFMPKLCVEFQRIDYVKNIE